MGVTATAQASDSVGGPSGTFPTVNLTPTGVNRLLLIHLSWFVNPGSDADTPTVDGSSVGVTLVGSIQTVNTGRKRHALYRLLNPGTTLLAITASIADTNTTGLVIGAVAYEYVHQTTPLGTPNQQTGNGTALSASVSDGSSGGLIVSSMSSRFPSVSVTHGQTLDWEQENFGDGTGAMTRQVGASATMTHTIDTAADWLQTVVAVLPSLTLIRQIRPRPFAPGHVR